MSVLAIRERLRRGKYRPPKSVPRGSQEIDPSLKNPEVLWTPHEQITGLRLGKIESSPEDWFTQLQKASRCLVQACVQVPRYYKSLEYSGASSNNKGDTVVRRHTGWLVWDNVAPSLIPYHDSTELPEQFIDPIRLAALQLRPAGVSTLTKADSFTVYLYPPGASMAEHTDRFGRTATIINTLGCASTQTMNVEGQRAVTTGEYWQPIHGPRMSIDSQEYPIIEIATPYNSRCAAMHGIQNVEGEIDPVGEGLKVIDRWRISVVLYNDLD
jgi:alkylated DNA repair dioxygenase AlkB